MTVFKPAWWARNAHLQTILAKYTRRKLTLDTICETVELPDSDFLDLAWTDQVDSDCRKPIVILLHGLAGSLDSHYVKGMLKALQQQGWVGVLMHFRGCSGRPNRLGRSYHSGDTRDIAHCIDLISQRCPNSKLAAIGFSLGGNVLTRYLAKYQNNPLNLSTIKTGRLITVYSRW